MKFDDIKKQELITTDKTFCMFPWIHLYTEPSGKTMPCCNTISSLTYPSTVDNTLLDIFNHPMWKQMRLDMLNGIKPEHCSKCYDVEKSGTCSYRTFANAEFGQYIDVIDNTLETGEVTAFNLRYIDVRLSNLCNFACTTCGDLFSTTWIALVNKTRNYTSSSKYTRIQDNSKENIIDQIKPHLKTAHQIYFAGGEPLIMPEHYDMLAELKQQDITDVKLRYNSNLSTIEYKGTAVYEYWKDIKRVDIGASIDAIGTRAEVIRSGTNWNIIERNIKTLLQYNNIVLNYDTVISSLNIDHLPELYEYLFSRNLVKDTTSFSFNILFTPPAFSIQCLPIETKEKLTHKLLTWADTFKKKYAYSDPHTISKVNQLVGQIAHIVTYMTSIDAWDYEDFKFEVKEKINFYQQDWEDELPMIANLYDTGTY